MFSKESQDFDYEGGDLEAMMLAEHYYRWIFDTIRPYIGQSVVEIGAGVGSFSRLLMKAHPKQMVLVEPSRSMHRQLKVNMQPSVTTGISTHNDYLKSIKAKIAQVKPDTFVYVNVFEHIENDEEEIRDIAGLLQKDGHAIIFVPALHQLYGGFDKNIGHYRRYTKRELKHLCDVAGLDAVKVRYMDMPGILPWFISFKLMKRTGLVGPLVHIYDNLCVPIIRTIETLLEAPIGKNLLLIAKKR